MHHTHIPALPWQERRSDAGRHRTLVREISAALGGRPHTGTWGGGHPFAVELVRVPPGAALSPFQAHLAQWEFVLVLSGAGEVRRGESTDAVRPGHVFVHPPGEAHQLRNSGSVDLEVMLVTDQPLLDAVHDLDSGTWHLRAPGQKLASTHLSPATGSSAAAPNDRTAASPLLTASASPGATLADRLRHTNDIPWESWDSPRRRFLGTSQELSIALGAQRNTPIGLGGHPFEVEFSRLDPGMTGCPFHSHAAQWELYWIVRGQATVRAGETAHTFGPGDVVLHPPGEPHQIRNASATERLEFYLIADNPPADYWHYPDSRKWGFRAPRMFFRPTEADYYDGEE
ncbi:cupin domain-containing protein [Opitutus sp. ER46]|uniref:cupin domain-containing protein n=1 Tax=Opitutus sp. ER46 TaxID=2161864 RepID=UPI001304A082|nr:cupin domain-containing protein [Opitutus sp. ER46]